MRSRLEIGIERHSKPRRFEKCVDSMHSDPLHGVIALRLQKNPNAVVYTHTNKMYLYYLVYTHASTTCSIIWCTHMRVECIRLFLLFGVPTCEQNVFYFTTYSILCILPLTRGECIIEPRFHHMNRMHSLRVRAERVLRLRIYKNQNVVYTHAGVCTAT